MDLFGCFFTKTARRNKLFEHKKNWFASKFLHTKKLFYDNIANFLIKHKDDDEFECTAYNHVDIEYRYIIDIPKKEISCLDGNYNDWDSPRPRFITRKKIDLSEYAPLRAEELYK